MDIAVMTLPADVRRHSTASISPWKPTLRRMSSLLPAATRQSHVIGKYGRSHMYQPNVGQDLDIVKQDHCVITHPATNKNRRTLVINKENGSWGFTLQSYGIHHMKEQTIEYLTYVDYVELGGPADLAGMRKGDIILSVDGHSMENIDHHQMVKFLRNCGNSLRIVVLFEDCSRKVELHLRYMKLKNLLVLKEKELQSIDKKINSLQNKTDINNCDSELSTVEDCLHLTPTVNALATLPRKPKQVGSKKPLLSRFCSNTHLNNNHSNSCLSVENINSNTQLCNGTSTGSLPLSPVVTENRRQLCTKATLNNGQLCKQTTANDEQATDNKTQATDKNTQLCTQVPCGAETQVCINETSSSEQCTTSTRQLGVVDNNGCSPEVNNLPDNVAEVECNSYTPPDLLAGQYNSLPVRGAKHCPTSPINITISPVTTSQRHNNAMKPSSSDSESSLLSYGTDMAHLNTAFPDDFQSFLDNSGPGTKTYSKDRPTYLKIGFGSKRSMSFRGSFRHSISPAMGMSYVGSSNHVLTEHNSRMQFDPELIRIKQGHLGLQSPDYTEMKQLPMLFRSVSSPAMKVFNVVDEKTKLRRSADERILNQIRIGSESINMAAITMAMRNKSAQCKQESLTEGHLKAFRAKIKSDSYCDSKPGSYLTRYNYTKDCADCGSDYVPDRCDCNSTYSSCSCDSQCSLDEHCDRSQAAVNKSNHFNSCDKNGNITNAECMQNNCLRQFCDGDNSLYSQHCSKNMTLGVSRSCLISGGEDLKCEAPTMSRSLNAASTLYRQNNGSPESVSNTLCLAEHIINYTRYKDILHDAQYVNERDQCTKL